MSKTCYSTNRNVIEFLRKKIPIGNGDLFKKKSRRIIYRITYFVDCDSQYSPVYAHTSVHTRIGFTGNDVTDERHCRH